LPIFRFVVAVPTHTGVLRYPVVPRPMTVEFRSVVAIPPPPLEEDKKPRVPRPWIVEFK
jgi:hypothetical protein